MFSSQTIRLLKRLLLLDGGSHISPAAKETKGDGTLQEPGEAGTEGEACPGRAAQTGDLPETLWKWMWGVSLSISLLPPSNCLQEDPEAALARCLSTGQPQK